jgi:hypothetical protein
MKKSSELQAPAMTKKKYSQGFRTHKPYLRRVLQPE